MPHSIVRADAEEKGGGILSGKRSVSQGKAEDAKQAGRVYRGNRNVLQIACGPPSSSSGFTTPSTGLE